MAAVAMHIVRLRLLQVDVTGQIVRKEDATIKDMLKGGGTEPRVIPVVGIASSTNYPTIEEYLILEAAAGFVLKHIDQTMIVTYPAGS